MWFISPFVPIFFRPSNDVFGAKSKYTQIFAPTDNILLEVLSTGAEAVPTLKLKNVCSGSSKALVWKSWQMNEKKVLYYYVLTGLECGVYNIDIGGQVSEPFQVTDNERELKNTTLIKYSMRNNRMRLDGVFWIDGIQYFFEFRVPGGFKDDDRNFSVDNEQFISPYGNIVEMYSMESTQKVFTLGNSIGCPVWFGELLNRLLCCSHVYFDGVQFARKDSSIPEKTQGVAGIKSYVFKQSLQEVKDDLSVIFGEGGGGNTGGGDSGSDVGVDILRLINDEREPTDENVFSSLRTIYEIRFYCEYYAEEYDKRFLHKDRPDGTSFPITFGDWVKFGEFLTGISGGYIDKHGQLEMEEGIFRKRLFVPEIAYNRITYFKGRMCASPGGGCTVKEWTDNGDGSYTITPDLTEADGLSQFVDDILTTYFTAKSPEGKLQGFEEMKFRVTSADYEAKTFVMVPKPGTAWKPGDSMVLAQTGNFTDPDRQTYILIDTVGGNNNITFFDHANTWDAEPAQEKSWLGKKKGRTVHGIPADNYSAVLQNIIMSGKIFQVDDITGEAFRVPLFKGAWASGVKNAYYDEVTYNGSSWICVNPAGTTSEPVKGNPDWLECVAKGENGKDGIQGPKGNDGLPTYFHIKYAPVPSPTSAQLSETPDVYIGTYVDNIASDSDDPQKYTWARFQGLQGEKGIPGFNGDDGRTSYLHIKYSEDGTSFTSNNGETPGQWIGQYTDFTEADSADFSRYTWTKIKGENGKDGKDGVSVTNCGAWHTGLHVPYMGMTKMAGRVFLCTAPAGTDNPPMWTVTTKEGNRILQTQDGGKTYGYIITGDLNTAEYELLVENGKDGRDGKDYEWIFKHTVTDVAPPTPGTSQVDDYVPEGWHDDAIGVTESLPYEWACCRTKKDGVWSAFSPAALWAKFGFDGESAIVADFDNEMESVALTHEGRTAASSVLNTTVGMWYGMQKLQLKSIACVTPAGVTESHNINTGVIAFTVAAGIAMPERSQVRITITAEVNGADVSRELVFIIAGVRAGSPGTDAVLYRLVPSVSSVNKKKDGTYSVGGVSCIRTKTVGGNTTITTDGVLKYSKDGGGEVEIQNGTEISPRNFTTRLQFVYYVNGQVVDRETIPMVVDGADGANGADGADGTNGKDGINGEKGDSVKAGGEWRTANIPYAALTICTMGGRSWLSKVATSNPPLWTVTTKDGNRILQTQDGGKTYGYVLTGGVNTAEWELLTSDGTVVYLTGTVSNIRVSNAGSLVPSAFKVYAKRTLGSAALSYSDGYLAARGYSNGIWSTITGPVRGCELTVNASAGYSTFSVRCYQSQADAAAWGDNFIAEQSVGVSYDGETGRTGSEPRPRGLFADGNTYVWNEHYHDIVLATFNDRTIPFRVRAYGASVTVPPSSMDGDANWEPAQQFQFVATDLLLSRQIVTDMIVVSNVRAKNKEGEITCEIDGGSGMVNISGSIITPYLRIDLEPDMPTVYVVVGRTNAYFNCKGTAYDKHIFKVPPASTVKSGTELNLFHYASPGRLFMSVNVGIYSLNEEYFLPFSDKEIILSETKELQLKVVKIGPNKEDQRWLIVNSEQFKKST